MAAAALPERRRPSLLKPQPCPEIESELANNSKARRTRELLLLYRASVEMHLLRPRSR